MSECLTFEYQVSGDDFTRAGEASSDVKNKLKMMGVDSGTTIFVKNLKSEQPSSSAASCRSFGMVWWKKVLATIIL